MKLNIKTKFEVTYPEENYKYYNANSGPRKRITRLLLLTCKGFCMYCGKKVTIEGDKYYQIEHAVDKDGNINQSIDKTGALVHCKYNLAISCPECNQVCKKVVDKVNLQKYAPIDKCPKKCLGICEKYNSIREEYVKKNAIILQPLGIASVGDNAIKYNLFKHIYEPNDHIANDDSIFLVQNHIDRFRLNGDRFSSAVVELCVKIVGFINAGVRDTNSLFCLLELEKPNNIIGILFVMCLKEYFFHSTCQEINRFCKMLIILDAI